VLNRPISRRRALQLVAVAVATVPVLADGRPAGAQDIDRVTLEAWSDTIVPGQKRSASDRAIAGACAGPGAVQAGVWDLMNDPDVGIAPALPAFVTLLNTEAVAYASAHHRRLGVIVPPFVALSFDDRTALALQLLDPRHVDQLLWYALAAMPILAFHTAAQLDTAAAVRAGHPGLAWIDFPEPDADGLWRFPEFSYRQQLADAHPATTSTGNPP
jgi:enediyne biosynthesis protein E8